MRAVHPRQSKPIQGFCLSLDELNPAKQRENDMKMCDEGQPEKCVCVKGVPSRATSEDLLDFFAGLKIEESGIHILFKSRRCFGKVWQSHFRENISHVSFSNPGIPRSGILRSLV